MKERQYFVIMPNGHLLFVEITPERKSVIDDEFSGDEEEYLYTVLSEEFDFSVNNVDWSIVPDSCITCFGRNPSITKL